MIQIAIKALPVTKGNGFLDIRELRLNAGAFEKSFH